MTIDQFFKRNNTVREIIGEMFQHLGKKRWQRVDIVMLLIQMTVYGEAKGKGKPFASARWYAGECLCSEKTVDRTVKWLRERGFLSTRRLRRRDTEAAWLAHNDGGRTNDRWAELSAETGGKNGPFRMYPADFLSTNEIDLTGLLLFIRKLMGRALRLDSKGYSVKASVGGILFKAWFFVGFGKDAKPIEPVETWLAVDCALT